MLKQLTQATVIASVAGGLAIAPIANAQLVVTGGNISFRGTQIYVPNVNSNLGTVIYNGAASPIVVRTSGISINDNVILRGQILPILSTCPCTQPAVGDTGSWMPTLTFVAYSSSGEPTLFRNIPAELNFRVDGLQPTGAASAINRFESFPALLTQSGTAVNASSFGGVQRTTPVVVVEFGQTPSASLQSFGVASVTPGINYPGDINATITSGIVNAPLANSFTSLNNSPSGGSGAGNNGNNGSLFVSASTYVGAFDSVTSIVSVYGAGSTLTDDNTNLEDDEDNRGDDDEDEDTIFVDENKGERYVVVGLSSRVFPGLIGVEVIKEEPRTTGRNTPNQSTTQAASVTRETTTSTTK